jgi:HemY protein
MWRALLFIALLALGAFGAVWLADRPGDVLVTWGGYRIQTSVAVAAVLTIALAVALSILYAVVTGLMRMPARWRRSSRQRQRNRGFAEVSRGLVAVGAGDSVAARRHANEAQRLLGREPLTLLLAAQAAQIAGDRAGAQRAFRAMTENADTRVLGLRGLFVEARRQGDTSTAHAAAAEAARLAPAASWANDAVLEAHASEGDWRSALGVVDRRASLGLIDKATARRHRAVLLTALAQSEEDGDPEGASQHAQEALRAAPSLVPAASIAGRLLARRGDLRRAAKLVEAAWKAAPHPELAEAYLNLRPGDSALDRLHRAETLAKLSSWDPEARLALARTALEAREFKRARDTLAPLLEERPTVRACLLMAEIEQAEHGDAGQTRSWLARAARSPRDPAWMADGVVFEQWAPISPISGKIDAFVWQAPPDVLPGPTPFHDDVTGDLDERGASQTPAALEAPATTPERAPPPARAQPVELAPPPRPVEPAREPERPVTVPAEPVAAGEPVRAAAPVREPQRPLAGPARTVGTAEPSPRAAEVAVVPSAPPPARAAEPARVVEVEATRAATPRDEPPTIVAPAAAPAVLAGPVTVEPDPAPAPRPAAIRGTGLPAWQVPDHMRRTESAAENSSEGLESVSDAAPPDPAAGQAAASVKAADPAAAIPATGLPAWQIPGHMLRTEGEAPPVKGNGAAGPPEEPDTLVVPSRPEDDGPVEEASERRSRLRLLS